VAPIGLFFGRCANFVNHELWGAPTNVPWAVRFPEVIAGQTVLGPPRHPSQLYEALLEGVILFLILAWMFWKTEARYQPGKLAGTFLFFYGIFRFLVEFVREPDPQLAEFAQRTGLHMGQWLSIPLMLLGAWLMWTAQSRRVKADPKLGSAPV
jgi:phosphatidylglycerol:prolipoprotein diacylglycerol transferase